MSVPAGDRGENFESTCFSFRPFALGALTFAIIVIGVNVLSWAAAQITGAYYIWNTALFYVSLMFGAAIGFAVMFAMTPKKE